MPSADRSEKFRDIVSKAFSKFNFYKKQLSSFNELYAVNDETKNIMQQVANKPCKKICEISIGENFKALNVIHIKKQPVEIVYLGRLIELKGIMLLMDVIKNIKTDIPFHVSLYGKGELENEIKQYIKKYKLENTVAVKGNIDYSQVIGVYQNADIFVHPTLRDSAGTVFIEAIANKLPIVALDQSFAHDLSEHECGLFVNTEQSKEEIINEFAGKLKELIENYDLRVKLGQIISSFDCSVKTDMIMLTLILQWITNLTPFMES